jgi:polysaccharide export outer membrane protein
MNSQFMTLFCDDSSSRVGSSARPLIAILALVLATTLLASRAQGQKIVNAAKPDETNSGKATVTPPQPPPAEYIIGPTDVLDVSVWKEPDISRTVTVRPDGKISLPLVGELNASGQTPVQLQALIREKLATYITNPEVTILMHDARSGAVSIFGKVAKAGSYPLTKQMTVLDVIAAAGGFKDYAKFTKIYVLRVQADGTTARYKFNFKEVIKGQNLSQNILVEPRDTIYIP